MTASRFWSIVIVVLIHIVLGYAFVTGLAQSVVKKVASDLKTFDVVEEPPPPEELPPPPPPDKPLPPPPVTLPPRIVDVPTTTSPVIAPPPPVIATPQPVYVAPPSPPPAAPPPPPPPPPAVATKATQRGGAITDEDYPPAAQRNEEQGVSRATFVIGTDGRVQSCNASGASPTLDAETCKLIMRRFRFKPATDASGNPVAETRTQSVRWQLPK